MTRARGHLFLHVSSACENFRRVKECSSPELEHVLQRQGFHLLEGILRQTRSRAIEVFSA